MSKSNCMGLCIFERCGRQATRKSLCQAHYQQLSHGKPLAPLFITHRPHGTPPRIICDEQPCLNRDLEGPCHVFRGRKDEDGYGKINYKRRNWMVHRWCWEKEIGPIPDGLVVDHECRNRACCNVDHLRVVTTGVNVLDNSLSIQAANAAKTHCKRGHPFDENNTRMQNGSRVCRACGNEAMAQIRLAKKQRLLASP